MAGKEATVYILDVGRSMGERRHGRDHTDLEWALDYIWDKITTTVSRHSIRDETRLLRTISGHQFREETMLMAHEGFDWPKDLFDECDWLPYG